MKLNKYVFGVECSFRTLVKIYTCRLLEPVDGRLFLAVSVDIELVSQRILGQTVGDLQSRLFDPLKMLLGFSGMYYRFEQLQHARLLVEFPRFNRSFQGYKGYFFKLKIFA